MPSSRSYRATYRLPNTPEYGGRLIFRDFITSGSYLDAVAHAEGARHDDEKLLSVQDMTYASPLTLVHQ